MKNYVITIARGYGSGGKEIAQKLSDKLGIPWYERQILTMASEESGIAESLFAESDEKLVGHKFSMLLGSMPNKYVVDPNSPKFVKSDNLFHIQSELIKSLARTESCIIVGKAANINAIQLSIISVVFCHREPLFFMPKNFKNITKNS